MNGTRPLRDAGQSLWLDKITRSLLTGGGLRRYIDVFSITGLTSNPTLFDHAIRTGHDAAIRKKTAAGISVDYPSSDDSEACSLAVGISAQAAGLPSPGLCGRATR